MKKIISIVVAAAMMISSASGIVVTKAYTEKQDTAEKSLRLWYDEPAPNSHQGWENRSLPIGNGYMGASIFGGVEHERIQFNEKTLWTGGPSESRPDYKGGNKTDKAQYLKQIQQLLAEGKEKEAKELLGHLTGEYSEYVNGAVDNKGYGSFQSFGNIYLDFDFQDNGATNYVRDLDLRTAVASVSFDYDGTSYKREYFTSYPDNMMVSKISANKDGKVSFDLRVESSQDGSIVANGNTITLSGAVKDNGLRYESQVKVINEGGTVTKSGNNLKISGADSVTLLMTAETDYKNEYPAYRSGVDPHEGVQKRIDSASNKSYDELLKVHLQDYKEIFDRVELDLNHEVDTKTTDEVIADYKKGTASKAVEVLLFQYGRYLEIASSREGSLPSNLQGVWSDSNTPAWHADYHMNVNLQMNYWPAYSTNMAECAIPLVEYVDSLREPGRVTAKEYAGIESTKENPENGFMAHTQNNPFGWTCPGWSFYWGWSPAAVPWIIQNVWEYYEFTEDEDYLREEIYPIMREQLIFWEQYLIEDPKTGRMVSSPSYSPEHGPVSIGNTYEQELVWQLYNDTIKAAKILGVDSENLEKWQDTMDKLLPLEIGEDGQIKEWAEETTLDSTRTGLGAEKGHRHLSHLLGLFPGDGISAEDLELLEAAKVSLNDRGDGGTGWAKGHKINLWARAQDGNRAYKLIQELFKTGILDNLWDTHAPFQIDGNFGYTSGVAEMLLQSNLGYIQPLAALPDAWSEGSIKGLIARGNFEVDIDWSKGTADEIKILSKNGNECTIVYPNISMSSVRTSDGKDVDFVVEGKDKITFNTTKGEEFVIDSIPTNEGVSPSNLEAYRTDDSKVDLSWDSIEDSVYNVYRKVGNGSYIKIASNLTNNSFTDLTADRLLGNLSYKVSSVKNLMESQLSEAVIAEDLTEIGIVDNSSARVKYSGSWSTWKDNAHIGGSIAFVEDSVAGESISLKFVGTGIKVITPKNSNFGKVNIFIDDELVGNEVDLYNASYATQKVIFEKTDLEKGLHTIKVVATGTHSTSSSKNKLEFDAFEVLDSTNNSKEISIGTKSGITTIGKANSSIQMIAKQGESEEITSDINWTVTSENGGETSLATINEDGILTVLNESGVIKVTGTHKNNSSISSSVLLKLEFISNETSTLIDDRDSKINYVGNWKNWDDGKHYNGTIKYNESPNNESYIEYSFTGTGIDVITSKNPDFGMINIYIDGEKVAENIDLYDASSLSKQEVFSKKNLENKTHVIKIEPTGTHNSSSSRAKVEFDAFRVYSASTSGNSVDKSELQELITSTDNLIKGDYSSEDWSELTLALESAVDVMNNSEATSEDVSSAIEDLTNAIAGLVKINDTKAPTTPEKLNSINVEKNSIFVKWDKSTDNVAVTGYEVYLQGKLIETVLSEGYNFTELESDTNYEISVRAIDAKGNKSELKTITVKTLADEVTDVECPTNIIVEKIADDKAKITWTASESENIIGYNIYIAGKLVASVDTTEAVLEGLELGNKYMVNIVAINSDNKLSKPTRVSYIHGDVVEIIDKTELETVIEDAKKVDITKYTDETVEVFTKALENAKKIFEDENATKNDVSNAAKVLKDAISSLVKKEENKPNPDEKPGDNEEKPNPDENPGEEDTEKPDGDKPGSDEEKPDPDENSGEEDTEKPDGNKPESDEEKDSSSVATGMGSIGAITFGLSALGVVAFRKRK